MRTCRRRSPQRRGLLLCFCSFITLTQSGIGMAKELASPPNGGNPELLTREPEGEFLPPQGYRGWGHILFTPDGANVISSCHKPMRGKKEINIEDVPGVIAMWEVPNRRLKKFIEQAWMPSAMAFFPDGKRLLAAGWDRKIRVLTLPKWEVLTTFEHDPPKTTVQNLVVFPDGKRFATNNSTYRGPRVWDAATLKVTPLKGPKEQGRAIAVSRDGKRLAAAYSAPLIEIWDVDRLEVIGRLHREKGVFLSVTFSADGKWIAAGSIGPGPHRALVSVWDSTTFKKHRDYRGCSDDPGSIAFTNDSKLLLSCAGDERNVPGKVCIWEVESGKLLYAFSPWIHGCVEHALSPDNRWLVTCGADSTLRLWDFAKIRREIGK
jgi:WD40 repeat protein